MVRQPVDENDRLALEHLRARRDRLAQRIRDMESDVPIWNAEHPNEEPMDAEEYMREPRKLLAAIDAELGL